MTSAGGASATTGSFTTGSTGCTGSGAATGSTRWAVADGDRRRAVLAPCAEPLEVAPESCPHLALVALLLHAASFTVCPASPSRASGAPLFERQVSADRPPRTSVGTTVRKR